MENNIVISPIASSYPLQIRNKEGVEIFTIDTEGKVMFTDTEGNKKECSSCCDIALAFAAALKNTILTRNY